MPFSSACAFVCTRNRHHDIICLSPATTYRSSTLRQYDPEARPLKKKKKKTPKRARWIISPARYDRWHQHAPVVSPTCGEGEIKTSFSTPPRRRSATTLCISKSCRGGGRGGGGWNEMRSESLISGKCFLCIIGHRGKVINLAMA